MTITLAIRSARRVEESQRQKRAAWFAQPARVNGAAGAISCDSDGRPFSVLGFTVRRGKIVEIDVLADPARVSHINLAVLDT